MFVSSLWWKVGKLVSVIVLDCKELSTANVEHLVVLYTVDRESRCA